MANTYTPNIKLGYPALADTGWAPTIDNDFVQLDALAPVGGLAVTTHEVPSASLTVDVAAGAFVDHAGTVHTYAGRTGYSIPTGTTTVLYLDGTASWALTAGASYPATAHVRLATVAAGASTITTITDNRQVFAVCGPGAQTGGAATASGTYGSGEQTMLQKCYDCLRAFGMLS
jgi:hypothetical protein